jgi:hypothetical protein
MPRSLDHIVHAVRDLDAAAALYEKLGFIVSARNKHPWGTHNRIVQLDGNYIELLTVGEPDKIAPHAAHSFSFGAFHRDFLVREQGLSMLLLRSHDAKANNAAWREAAIGDFEVFDFEREGQRADGATVKLAFSLIFAADPNAPDTGFAACQHYYPENFWNPAVQKHVNGVKGIGGVVLVADEPARHRDFLEAYTGGDARDGEGGFAIHLSGTTIDIVTPAAFLHRFGVAAPDTARGMRLAALRFSGAEKAALQRVSGALLLFEPGR